MAARFCEQARAARIDELGSDVTGWLELSDRQQAAWQEVEGGIAQAMVSVRKTCVDGDVTSLPDRLAQAEAMMAPATAGLHELRPAVDASYVSLDEKERAKLDERMARFHR